MRLSKGWQRAFSWCASLILPITLTLLAVRLILNPWFVQFEYRTPNFPADPYGFTREERIRYALLSLDYLLNDEDISFVASLRFPEGQQAPEFSCQYMDDCTRLYNDRELKHMVDAKIAIRWALGVFYTSLILLALGVNLARSGGWWHEYRAGLSRGGWITVGLIVVILLFILLAFDVFFVWFHQIIFEAGTWTFWWSDTFIRLFPERFWQDTFLVVGAFTAILGVLCGRLFRGKKSVKSK